MFSQFFGNYLLNSGYITSEQLSEALAFAQSTHVKFGIIAVDEGFMTGVQAEEVHEKQKQMDKRFGEIAIELGYLTDEQVEKMLSAQKQNHLLLAQALVDKCFMSFEEFSQALVSYKKEHSLSDERFEEIKKGNIDALVESILPVDEKDKKDFFVDYISLFAKNMIRFIDDQIHLEISKVEGQLEADWLVNQVITGPTPLFTAILTDESSFLKIASVYAEEELHEVDELAQASVSEFLNLHNGIFLVNQSNKGNELNMTPQHVTKSSIVDGMESGHLVTVYSSYGRLQVLLSEHPETIDVLEKDISQMV
ncbi:hypothetical protein LS684_05090 [Cytobacillus spongiae]|uniref:hypothetical protein n=1 Tax=Cytobacillus spongiae TaxID=2901381 RepID=UPI001F1C0E44|nr:hypothetical protein [Cytobacillus spongiae]UII56819.1 hypothetical protein LS684_05090 [Cytobacillus spongiae]